MDKKTCMFTFLLATIDLLIFPNTYESFQIIFQFSKTPFIEKC